MAFRVLFLCTANSARSVLAEATLNHLGGGRFRAFSAGSRPLGRVHPQAVAQLERAGVPVAGLRSKSWDEFEARDAAQLDAVITVCDSAVQEPCPVIFGDFARAHWGLPDPVAVRGSERAVAQAFAATHEVIRRRVEALVALPVETLGREPLAAALDEIASRTPAVPLA